MSQQTVLAHQAFQPFPKLQEPVTNENGTLSIPWYRLLITMWQRLGGSGTVTNQTAILQEAAPNGLPILVLDATTGDIFGELQFSNTPGGPVEPLAPVTSPFIFSSLRSGTVAIASGQVELSRDLLKWYTVSLTGGAIPVLKGDSIRVTWYNSVPEISFFPTSSLLT